MDHEANQTLVLAALGRPFSLGMLYDCRQDSLIPGMTLWDCCDLEKDISEGQQPNTEFEIVASESIEDKSSALNVEASLKASFLGGLVEVGGAAKYLNDQRTSKNQARVTLKYKTTTKFQQLSMSHLGRGNVKHPNVFKNGIATHVVTAILYGAQAFFVFNREVSEEENHQDIQGNLQLVIKKIPLIAIEGEGSLHMEDKERANVQQFSCKFHGDYTLQQNPVCFQDAIEVYQSLPSLLGSRGENAIPVKVWLLPLSSLDSADAKVVRQISIRLVQELQSVLEDFAELEMRCNDAMRKNTVQMFPQIGKKIRTFKERCSEFKQEFRKTLAKKLPSIRGGGEEEAVLADVLKKRLSSPFSNARLNQWMECKEREISYVKSFTNFMKNTKIVTSQSGVDEEAQKAKHAVCFVFTSLGVDEPFLSTLLDYLQEKSRADSPPDAAKDQWHLVRTVSDKMRDKVKLFIDFAEANKGSASIRFLAAGLTNETHQGATILLYEDGFFVREDFEPPSKPESVTVGDVCHNSVTLRVCPPRFGAESVSSYLVEYRVSEEDQWQRQTTAKAEAVTVSGLTANTEYMFRCRAVTSVGVGPATEVGAAIGTLPCSPPGTIRVEENSSEISVSWEKPSEIGQDVQLVSYIVEFASTNDTLRQEDLKWDRLVAGAEKAIISRLQSGTEYAVKVSCDCGFAGKSKDSATVRVCTTKRQFPSLAEYLKHISKRVASQCPSLYKLPLTEEDMDIPGCRKYHLGTESMRPNRTIMLLGATGSGKSTLINGMINYITGLEWKDTYRFKLVHEDQTKSQANSQTNEVTVYKLNHQEGFTIAHSLTIIDTPGFGDTRGVTRDREITEQIRRLFTSTSGVSEIDAVCFVTQAALARLTATQRYVFDSILSIFGKDVAENIEMLVTFADGKQPPVLEAINASGVPCPKNDIGLPLHFKFNNSALFADNRSFGERAGAEEDSDEDEDNFDEMFWNMGAKSMERFFVGLNKLTTKSLLMTKEVLQERKQLETAVEGLQPQVKAGLAKLEEIRTTREKIKEHETVLMSNENFEIEVDVIKPIQKHLTKKGEYITNCQRCLMTCHYPCAIANDSEKRGCDAMNQAGMCTVCPGKCVWSVHFNQTYRWEYVQVKKKRTLQELKDKYEKASKEKMTTQDLIEMKEEQIAQLQDMIVSLMEQSASCLTRLQEIALRPNPLTTPGYIDMLIEGERSEAKEGHKARIQSLEAMKERANIISRVARKGKPEKTPKELSEEQQEKKEKKNVFQKTVGWYGF